MANNTSSVAFLVLILFAVLQNFSPITAIQSLLWPSASQTSTNISDIDGCSIEQQTLPWGVTNHATCPRDFINRIPPDILSRILVEVLSYVPGEEQVSSDLILTPFIAWQMRVSPFSLSHVCKYWMEVVNSTKRMWSSIVIWKPSKRQLNWIAHWMLRVDSHPLQWSLVQSDFPDEEEEEATLQALELLAYRCKTWQDMELVLRGERFPTQILKHLRSLEDGASGCQLRTVAITLKMRYHPLSRRNIPDDDSPVLPTYFAWNLLGSLSSLCRLYWDAPFTPGSSFGRNLKVLDLHSPISIEEFLERIPYCQRLEELYVHHLSKPNAITFLPEHMAMDVDPTPKKIMPALRRLGISSQINLSPMLQDFAAPRLVILEINSRLPVALVHFQEFISDSQCVLEGFSLCVQDVRLDARCVQLLLQMKELQSITTLSLLNMEFTDHNLQLLHRPGQRGLTLFPKLKDLTLGTCDQDIDVGILLRMLGSRYWALPRPIVPVEELVKAKVYVRHLPVELVKYAEMIDKSGQRMKDRPISCRFTYTL